MGLRRVQLEFHHSGLAEADGTIIINSEAPKRRATTSAMLEVLERCGPICNLHAISLSVWR
jgi:hypothetical protein